MWWARAANLGGILARALSFKGALQLLNAYHQQLRHSTGARTGLMMSHLLGAVALLRLPVRPGRVEPHAIKRRPKQHWLLNVPRVVARAALIAQRQCVLR